MRKFNNSLLVVAFDYKAMFKPLLALSPNSDGRVRREIDWAKRVLKKNNRVVWYLRWYRAALAQYLLFLLEEELTANDLQPRDANSKPLGELCKSIISDAEKHGGSSYFPDIYAVDHERAFLAHIYSLQDPAIEN